ncbi:MAG: hypothetical protein HUK03_01840 [Bacteroidaceae bacterium]|nr:hypothetical protein [Bacteroidaceae bacterium]
MLRLLLLVAGFVAIAVALLCIKVILLPDGKFSSMHIGDSKEMRRRGIHCVQSMDAMERRENKHRVSETRKEQ